jgi:hypothetical protein
MPRPARAEFDRLLKRQAHDRVKDQERDLRQAAQATVPIDKLTHSEEWDYFVSIIQEEMNGTSALLDSLYEEMNTDTSFEPHIMAQRKAYAMRVAERRLTLEAILALPKQIMEIGENAKLALENLDDE